MASTIADLLDGATANPTDRIPVARAPYGPGDNRYITPGYFGIVGAVRERLTADRIYYVRVDGSDSNNGLADTSGGAFRSIQKAVDTAAAIDLGVYRVTIQVGASGGSTYSPFVSKQLVGGAGIVSSSVITNSVTILGDVTTPANVRIAVTTSPGIRITHDGYGVGGFELFCNDTCRGIEIFNPGVHCRIGAMRWLDNSVANWIAGISVFWGAAVVNPVGAWTFAGLKYYTVVNTTSLASQICYGAWSFPDSPTVHSTCSCSYNATFEHNAARTGTVTGQRFWVYEGGRITTYTGDLNYFPGTIDGGIYSGGVYDDGYNLDEWRVIPDADGRTISIYESHGTFTNAGATAIAPFILPGAVAGSSYTFVVQDADGIRVTAAAGDTIRVSTEVSAAAGKIESTTIGSAVTLRAINATEWMAVSALGTWVVT